MPSKAQQTQTIADAADVKGFFVARTSLFLTDLLLELPRRQSARVSAGLRFCGRSLTTDGMHGWKLESRKITGAQSLRSSTKRRTVDALAPRGDEGRGKLR